MNLSARPETLQFAKSGWLLNRSKLDIFPKQIVAGPGVFTAVPVPGKTELV